jgi:hypothetical protein
MRSTKEDHSSGKLYDCLLYRIKRSIAICDSQCLSELSEKVVHHKTLSYRFNN